VVAGRLDRRGDGHLALVDRADACSGNSVGDVVGLDRAEEASGSAGLDGQANLGLFDLVLESHSLVAVVNGARLAGGLDRLDLLGTTTGPRRGETLRDEVVTGVP